MLYYTNYDMTLLNYADLINICHLIHIKPTVLYKYIGITPKQIEHIKLGVDEWDKPVVNKLHDVILENQDNIKRSVKILSDLISCNYQQYMNDLRKTEFIVPLLKMKFYNSDNKPIAELMCLKRKLFYKICDANKDLFISMMQTIEELHKILMNMEKYGVVNEED